MSKSLQAWRQPLFYLAAAALLAGIYARFRGLGSAPFAVDEYYLARSIENVLRTGMPKFDCGGFYTRGLALQYASAVMQLGGFSAEFAPRFICALCSLLSIPPVFILSQRVHGRAVALLVVTIISLSVWEVEMARFARMYAPFQAVFLWYMVFFQRYTVDRDARALWPMIALSIAGPLVWEGGVFLPLVNLLSLFLRRWPDRPRRADWIYLVSCAVLLAMSFWFVTADFRGYNAASWPPGYTMSLSKPPPDVITVLRLPLAGLLQHPDWIAGAIAPLVATFLALRWVWTLRSRRFLALGLVVALIAALAHQLLAAGAVILLLLLTRLISWKEFFARQALPYHAAILLCALFWLAFGILVGLRGADTGGLARALAMLGYQFLSVPDIVTVVIRPWAAAVPHLGAALLLLLAVSLYRAANDDEVSNYERILLIVFLVLLLAASASHPPRQETRYVFFLFPVAVLIAVATIARLAARITSQRAAIGVTSALALGGFALSEDFEPLHLLYIDSPAETFRVGLSPGMQSHLVIREDYRAIALWLQQNRSDKQIVINGVHGLDHYYSAIDYFYVDESDSNFPDWTCRRGTVERWGNYPLIYSTDSLAAKVAQSPSAYLVAFAYDRDQIMASLAALHPRIALLKGNIVIINLRG